MNERSFSVKSGVFCTERSRNWTFPFRFATCLVPPRKMLIPETAALAGFPASARYLVGVSGGRDSVALLHRLLAIGYKRLILCHLNHQLRGRAATTDARFVAKLAQDADLDCELGQTNVAALAKERRTSLETAARIARFAFFLSVARRRRCQTIFLGHHADDLVETALLNFFRGASPGGIASLRPVSVHRIGRTELTIVRPLLSAWRREIDDYVREHHLKFREDASNAHLVPTRNRIRHRILPYIEKQLGRRVRGTIWRAAQIWSDEDTLLRSLADGATVRGPTVDVIALRKIPVALQRRVIRSWLSEQKIPNLNFELVENIRRLIPASATSAKTNLPGDRFVRRQKNKLFIAFSREKR
jgi:tRNA(Ile)-lysidine synthase